LVGWGVGWGVIFFNFLKGIIMNTEAVWTFLSTQGADFGLKILGAIAAWVVGRWLIGMAVGLIGKAMERGKRIDATLVQYLKSIISVGLTLVLVLAILDIFGIKTTSFAALLAGAGLAIGAAWSGMLGNFAAGIFLQVLRPYKVGDFINAGGTLGTVKELGLFATTVLTPDNVLTVVGNNKVFSDNIQNFSTEPFRRVDCVAKVANGVDVMDAIARLRPAIAAIANVKTSPAPDIEILQFTPEGPLLCVRPYTHTDHYWQVYFDTHKAIVTTFGAAGYPVPETPVVHRTV
jgi:small conductance mechanosensitive channel